MIVVLGFSDKDHWLAVQWLRWVSWLCMKEGGDSSAMKLVLFGTQRVTADQWEELHRMHYQSDCMFAVETAVCPDERETGYPGCATHLFYRAMEYCEANHHGSPILWCEADTVAMMAGWAQAISAEYADAGAPFLGAQSTALCRHMPGVAVYPADWRTVSPCLGAALDLPDIALWGSGKSQAWDTGCAHEIVRRMKVSRTIHQVWKPRVIDYGFVMSLPRGVAIFHQCKTGQMHRLLDREFC